MAKVLVTGGKGFIGSHLIDLLLQKKHQITTLDKSTKSVEYEGWKSVNFIVGDILNKSLVNEAVKSSDYVFHLAGILGTSETIADTNKAVEANIIGNLNILESLKAHNKKGQTITIGGINWLNPYAITKLAAEKFSLMFQKEFNLDIKVIRGLNTYGSRQKHMPVRKAVPNFIISAIKNEPIEIYGDGGQILDLVYIKDLVNVMVKAMEHQTVIDHVLDAGTGVKTSVIELAKIIIKLTDSKSAIKYLPMRPGEPEHSVTLANTRTLKEIGYIPSTKLEEGLKLTIPWYKDFLKIN